MTIRCRADCASRTYGKYRRDSRGKKILNKDVRDEGTCVLSISSGIVVVDRAKTCTSFHPWEAE